MPETSAWNLVAVSLKQQSGWGQNTQEEMKHLRATSSRSGVGTNLRNYSLIRLQSGATMKIPGWWEDEKNEKLVENATRLCLLVWQNRIASHKGYSRHKHLRCLVRPLLFWNRTIQSENHKHGQWSYCHLPLHAQQSTTEIVFGRENSWQFENLRPIVSDRVNDVLPKTLEPYSLGLIWQIRGFLIYWQEFKKWMNFLNIKEVNDISSRLT